MCHGKTTIRSTFPSAAKKKAAEKKPDQEKVQELNISEVVVQYLSFLKPFSVSYY